MTRSDAASAVFQMEDAVGKVRRNLFQRRGANLRSDYFDPKRKPVGQSAQIDDGMRVLRSQLQIGQNGACSFDKETNGVEFHTGFNIGR